MSGKKLFGIEYAPYILKTTKTTVNGKTVWHSNKFINAFYNMDKFFLIFIKRNNYLYKSVKSGYRIMDY